MSFGVYMFCRHKYENSPKCAIKKAYSSKTYTKAQPNSNTGAEHQHNRGPGLARRPHAEGDG